MHLHVLALSISLSSSAMAFEVYLKKPCTIEISNYPKRGHYRLTIERLQNVSGNTDAVYSLEKHLGGTIESIRNYAKLSGSYEGCSYLYRYGEYGDDLPSSQPIENVVFVTDQQALGEFGPANTKVLLQLNDGRNVTGSGRCFYESAYANLPPTVSYCGLENWPFH